MRAIRLHAAFNYNFSWMSFVQIQFQLDGTNAGKAITDEDGEPDFYEGGIGG